MEITPIGVGAWAMGGGGWAFAWGPQDDNAIHRRHSRGARRGVNWIDTAAVYGLGHSEEVVARALAGRATAVRLHQVRAVWNEKREISGSLKADSVRRECEASLRRLKVDAIDLYQIHWPDPDEDIEEGWATLAKLKEEGKVRWIGVSNFNAAQMERCRAIAPVTSLQPPYSAMSPGGGGGDSALLPAARDRRDRVLADEVGPADGQDDARARRPISRRTISGAACRRSRNRSFRATWNWRS